MSSSSPEWLLATRDPVASVPGAAPSPAGEVFDAAVDEVSAELRMSRPAAARELAYATTIAALPDLAAAIRAGRVDRARALVLADACTDLTPPQATVLLNELLPAAGALRVSALASRARRAAIALDPAWAERRYREAVRERRVVGYLTDDGSATVAGQNLPADQAAACARVDALATAAKRAGAAATIDHLRAELFLGLLDGRYCDMPETAIIVALVTHFPRPGETTARTGAPTTRPTSGVEIRVGLGRLLGLDDQPGEIAGWGTVTASVARQTVARQLRSEWRFAIVDSRGRLVLSGLARHRPDGEPGQAAAGGIVELHVPDTLLSDPAVPGRHPHWTRLITDLRWQYQTRAPLEQDPAARFPNRRLRRRIQNHAPLLHLPRLPTPGDPGRFRPPA